MKLSLTNLTTHCWSCGTDDIEWQCKSISNQDVQDGQLRLNDIQMLFYLGCNDCSETVQTLSQDQAMTLMNFLYFRGN